MPLPTDIKPPFDRAKALAKVQAAEDGWNSRDPARVAKAYTEDSRWRNRGEYFRGRAEIERFLADKWQKELGYRLMKELWVYRQPDQRAFRVRVAQLGRAMVPDARQRALGV
jgi:uncharacterized protein